jgi:hypothetical protein
VKRTLVIAAALLLAGLLLACTTQMTRHEGTQATQTERISLNPGGPHAGSWQDDNLLIDYQYTLEPDIFRIQGTVSLTRRLTGTFTTVQNFSVRANLLTDDGTIARSLAIVVVGNSVIRQWRFNENTGPPPAVTAMVFSYNGRAIEGGARLGGVRRDNGVSTSFWRRP